VCDGSVYGLSRGTESSGSEVDNAMCSFGMGLEKLNRARLCDTIVRESSREDSREKERSVRNERNRERVGRSVVGCRRRRSGNSIDKEEDEKVKCGERMERVAEDKIRSDPTQ
jgi:hypothetical protein